MAPPDYKRLAHVRIGLCLIFMLGSSVLPGCAFSGKTSGAGMVAYLSHPVGTPPAVAFKKRAAKRMATLHQQQGGSTFSLRWGELSNVALYVACLYPDRGLVLAQRTVDTETLSQFIQANRLLLEDPRCVVGTWYNRDNGNTYVDVSAVFSDRTQAIQLARQYNQIMIWDLMNAKEIAIGGTGSVPDDLLAVEDRLTAELVK